MRPLFSASIIVIAARIISHSAHSLRPRSPLTQCVCSCVFVHAPSSRSVSEVEAKYYADGEDAYAMRKYLNREDLQLPPLPTVDAGLVKA